MSPQPPSPPAAPQGAPAGGAAPGPGRVTVLVVGAGQAGLSAAYHLRRRGFAPLAPDDDGRGPRPAGAPGTFVVLDADDAPGGAWRHRWDSLRMGTVNGIHELPGHPVPPADPAAPANDVLPAYFAEYERMFDLPVRRPVRVTRVERAAGGLHVTAEGPAGASDASGPSRWQADHVVNATGTWTSPHWPSVPGAADFHGRQLHTHDYLAKEDFAGQRVAIVGMGVSATQLLAEISLVAETLWFTRREPVWLDSATPGQLAEAVVEVDARTRAGLPPASVVSATGMHRTPWVREAESRGVLVRRPMFERIVPEGILTAEGRVEEVDVILWATGFRPALRHLAPLRLRTPAGGIRVEDSRAVDEPRLFLIGYGPSQSTVGANRAGRQAAAAILRDLRDGVGPVAAAGARAPRAD